MVERRDLWEFLSLFRQLWVIHAEIEGSVAPMVYILLQGHLEETYTRALRLVKAKLLEL